MTIKTNGQRKSLFVNNSHNFRIDKKENLGISRTYQHYIQTNKVNEGREYYTKLNRKVKLSQKEVTMDEQIQSV